MVDLANTKTKPVNYADLENTLQRAETVQDSLTQRMMRQLGKDNKLSKDAFYVLKQIRKLQFRYVPVQNHSLLRYNDGVYDKKGNRVAKTTRLDKHNWRKYKKDKEKEKLPKLESFA